MVRRRPLRSTLAAAGLSVTLGSALVAVAIAQRGKEAALEEIRRIGAGVLTVSAEPTRNRGVRARTRDVVTTLRLADARQIERGVPGVSLVAAEFRGVVPVKVSNLARQASVSGIEPSYADLREAPMRAGRMFDPIEDTEGRRVAVLGGRVARDLFVGRDPVGELIRLRGIPFIVIGVFAERGTGLDAFDEDEVVFVPLHTARLRLFPVDYVQRLFIRVHDSNRLLEADGNIVRLLQMLHRSGGKEPPDFRVQDQRRLVLLRETAMRRLSDFQAEAAIALLSAGTIGMFALQLLAVRERRAEIGVRRALGATRAMILQQFLVEAAVICFSGSLAGILLAGAGARAADVSLSPLLTVTAFAACCLAGIAASAGPANNAAGVSPAVAIRAP